MGRNAVFMKQFLDNGPIRTNLRGEIRQPEEYKDDVPELERLSSFSEVKAVA